MRAVDVLTHLNYRPKRFIVLTGRQLVALLLGVALSWLVYQQAMPLAPDDGRPTVLPAALVAAAPEVRIGVGAVPVVVIGLATAANLPQRVRADLRWRRLPSWTVSRG